MQELLPGRTQAEVAAQIGMKPDAFSRALNGSRGFAASELARLSELLQTSMYWLATGEPDPNEALLVARHEFAADTGARSADWGSIRDAVDRVVLAYQQAGSMEPSSDVPSDPRRVREELGDGFVRWLAERLGEKYGVDVVRVDGIRTACSRAIGGRVVLVVNETGNWFYQNWSMAHELGHIALGHLDRSDQATAPDVVVASTEAAANAFAADLLLPSELVATVDWENDDPARLAKFLWDTGVSTGALRHRLNVLGIQPNAPIANALTWTTQKVLRRYPEWNSDTTDEVTARMEAAASRRFPFALQAAHVDLVSSGRVPKATLAWMLGVDEGEIEIEEPEPVWGDVDELARELGIAVPAS